MNLNKAQIEYRDLLNGVVIKNPKFLCNPFKTWNQLYDTIKDNIKELELKGEKSIIFNFQVPIDRDIKSNILTWNFDFDYLKARVFDECQNQPYEISKEELEEAILSITHLNNIGAYKMAKWVERICDKEIYKLRINNI